MDFAKLLFVHQNPISDKTVFTAVLTAKRLQNSPVMPANREHRSRRQCPLLAELGHTGRTSPSENRRQPLGQGPPWGPGFLSGIACHLGAWPKRMVAGAAVAQCRTAPRAAGQCSLAGGTLGRSESAGSGDGRGRSLG